MIKNTYQSIETYEQYPIALGSRFFTRCCYCGGPTTEPRMTFFELPDKSTVQKTFLRCLNYGLTINNPCGKYMKVPI